MLSDMVPQAAPIYQLTEDCKLETLSPQAKNLESDLQKAGSLKDFANELDNFVRGTRTKLPIQMNKDRDTYPPISGIVRQGLIFSALRKCIERKGFWSSEGLKSLLKGGYVMPGYDDDVVLECIIKYKCFAVFQCISQIFTTVDGKYVAKSLKAILDGVYVSHEIECLHKDGRFADCPVPTKVISDISHVMLLPVDPASLKDYLKLLTVEEAVLLLQCFVFMLHAVSPALERNLRKSTKFGANMTEAKIIMWMDLLISAHLIAFSSLDTLERLISDITLCVKKQQFYYGEICELKTILGYFCERGKKVKVEPVGKYSIETITL